MLLLHNFKVSWFMFKLSQAIILRMKLENIVYVRNSLFKLGHLFSLFCILQKCAWHIVLEIANKRDDVLQYLYHVVIFDNLPTKSWETVTIKKMLL